MTTRRDEMPDWLPRATFTVIGCVLSVVAGFWVIQKMQSLVAWLVISLFLSFAFEPLTNRLERRGWKRGRATGMILLVTFVVFSVFVASMVPLIISQVRELIDEVPGIVADLSSFLDSTFGIQLSADEFIKRLTDFGANLGVSGGDVASNVIGFGGRVIGGVFQIFTIAVFTFYMIVDGPKLRRKLMALMPPKQQKIFLETWEVAIEKMGGYLYVRLILAGLTAVTAFVVMTAARVPFALPLALWMGLISQFIPVIGTYFGAAIPALVALLTSPWSALVILIYVVIYQQIENYVLSPKLTARTMQLHPAIAIAAAIAGGTLYGPMGAFLALPAAAIFQVIAGTYLKRHDVINDDGDLLGVRVAKKSSVTK